MRFVLKVAVGTVVVAITLFVLFAIIVAVAEPR